MIKIKNKIFAGILISIFFISNTFAQDDCSVGETASSLVDYIKAERQVLSNVRKDLKKNDSSGSKIKDFVNSNLSGAKAKFIQLFNSLINWNGYYSYFKYYVTFPITQEIPYELIRDHKILTDETEKLDRFLTQIVKNQTDNSIISAPCNGVELKCPFLGGETASDIVGKLRKNNELIASYFRNQIMGDQFKQKDDVFLLDTKQFEKDYTKYKASIFSQNCGTWKKFNKQLKKIIDWQNIADTGIGEWQDAINMIRCSNGGQCSAKDKVKYIQREKDLLRNELFRQGLSANATKKMLQNLDNFNSKCTNKNIMETIRCGANEAFNNSVQDIKNAVEDFQNVVGGLISNFSFSKQKPVSIQELEIQKGNNEIRSNLEAKIKSLYEGGKSAISIGADSKAQLEEAIIKMYINIIKATKTLDNIINKSRYICNRQGQGLGICE